MKITFDDIQKVSVHALLWICVGVLSSELLSFYEFKGEMKAEIKNVKELIESGLQKERDTRRQLRSIIMNDRAELSKQGITLSEVRPVSDI
jgi:VIT1/CCC1 family predicted Fe2+/Mn2+ transporter